MADDIVDAAQKQIDDAAKSAGTPPAASPSPTPTATPDVPWHAPEAPKAPEVKPETPTVQTPAEEVVPAEKPLIVSAGGTPPAEPPPPPAAEQAKPHSTPKPSKKGGKAPMIIGLLLLLVTMPVLAFFAGGSEFIADLRSRASTGTDSNQCVNVPRDGANGPTTYTPPGATEVGRTSLGIRYCCTTGDTMMDPPGDKNAFCQAAGGGGGDPAPTQPADTSCSTAFTCNGICETNQATIDNFNNTWCDGLARWKWQACGIGSEPTAQKPNCGGTQPTPTPTPSGSTPPRCTVPVTSDRYCSRSNVRGSSACTDGTGVVNYCCPSGFYLITTSSSGTFCTNDAGQTPTPAGGGGGGGDTGGGETTREAGTCSNGVCTVDPSKNSLIICKCPNGLDANGDCAQNCEISSLTTANCQEIANQSCSSVQLDVKPAGITSPHDANDKITGTVVCNPNKTNNPSCVAPTGAGGGSTNSCGNFCSPGGPWAGTCCNSLSEGTQCKHTWDEGFWEAQYVNGCAARPTTTPIGGQCTRISVYKGGTKVVTYSTLLAGDAITIGVAGTSATRGRIRVNGGSFTETTTTNSAGEYTINFTIPSGTTTFTVEAEVFTNGAWK